MSDRAVAPASMASVIAVFVGGIIGTLGRFAIDALLPHETLGTLALSTAVVNVTGAFALGMLVGGIWKRPNIPDWVKAAVGPGVLGSFTTFSAIALNFVAGAIEGKWVDALLALTLSLFLGLIAAWLGVRLGEKTAPRGGA